MAQTINPAVSGNRGFIGRTISYGTGAYLGALATIILITIGLGLVASTVGRWSLVIPISIGILASTKDAGWREAPLPYRKRQVPEWYRDALPPVALDFVFGFLLGTGFLTYFTSSAHTWFIIALASAQPSFGVLLTTALAYVIGRLASPFSTIGTPDVGSVFGRFRGTRTTLNALRGATLLLGLATGLCYVASSWRM